MTHETIHLELTDTTIRLDAVLTTMLPDVSRAQIQDWIKKGLVTDDKGQALKASFKPKKPATITVQRPILKPFEPPRAEKRSQDLHIVFEDEHLLVINKPVGLTVHPGAGQHDGTLVNMLLGHTDGNLSDVGSHERPGIVHRLDKDTSGLLVVAKTNPVHVKLAELLQQRDMKRIYRALVYNVPSPRDGTVDTQIGRDPRHRQKMAVLESGGKHAVTHYTTLQFFGLAMSLVECRLETGRTHQIRVHMASIGCPVVGDPLYAGRHERAKRYINNDILKEKIAALPGQALHAHELIFPHPVTGETMHFTAAMPPQFQELLDTLGTHGVL